MTVRLERTDGVAWVYLDAPATRNALRPEDFTRLAELIEEVGRTPADRALVITGEGVGFCAGADLSDVRDDVSPLALMGQINQAARALYRLPTPSIAAVNGAAAGAGANLAFGCDLVLAAQSASFTEIFVRRGLSLDFGGSWLLPRLVGMQAAKRLAMLGDRIDAAQARALGLVSEVVADEQLRAAAAKLARRLADGPPIALAQTKQLLNQSLSTDFDTQLDAEAAAAAVNTVTADCREGIAAFLERRDPVFQGR